MPSLADQIAIRHGPRALIGDFLRQAEAAAHERGVSLSLAPLDALMAINRANSATWHPLLPTFDPAIGGATPDTSFAILGRNADGEVVATQAARLFVWQNTTLAEEYAALRMSYADPKASAAPGEVCRFTAPCGVHITGRVLYSGGAWYRQDYRGRLLSVIMPRIGRALAYAQWQVDYVVGMMSDGVVAGGMAERCGFTNVEDGVQLWNSSMAPFIHGFVVWMPAQELLEDLQRFVSTLSTALGADAAHRAVNPAGTSG
jgi:hypothetical protein